jgi:hypothetical protein
MIRALLAFLFSAIFAMPVTASASVPSQRDAGAVTTRSMSERSGDHGSDSVLCPGTIGLISTEDRVHRSMSELLERLAASIAISEIRTQSAGETTGSPGDDVVQCFRAAGVRLLFFGTAPPTR